MGTKLNQTLKAAGFSLTKPRLDIYKTLESSGPLTMLSLTRALPTINRSSVYRVVSLFERLGIVQRMQQGWKYKLELTDAFTPHHHHFTCTKCSIITNIGEPDEIEQMLLKLARQNNFSVTGHSLEITGICNNCRDQ